MRARVHKPLSPRLSFGQKVSRLGHRMKDPEWRRYGMTLMAGKQARLGRAGDGGPHHHGNAETRHGLRR